MGAQGLQHPAGWVRTGRADHHRTGALPANLMQDIEIAAGLQVEAPSYLVELATLGQQPGEPGPGSVGVERRLLHRQSRRQHWLVPVSIDHLGGVSENGTAAAGGGERPNEPAGW